MILIDTGPIVAFFDASDDYHPLCLHTLKSVDEPLVSTLKRAVSLPLSHLILVFDFNSNAQITPPGDFI